MNVCKSKLIGEYNQQTGQFCENREATQNIFDNEAAKLSKGKHVHIQLTHTHAL